MKSLMLLAGFAVAMVSTPSAFAKTEYFCKTKLSKYSKCTNVSAARRGELARRTDGGVAVAFTYDNGNLLVHHALGRNIDQNSRLVACQVTNSVETKRAIRPKFSSSKGDSALGYFVRNGDLYQFNAPSYVSKSGCAKSEKQNLSQKLRNSGKHIADVTSYKLRPANEYIVGAALLSNSNIMTWTNRNVKMSGFSGKSHYTNNNF